MRGMLFNSFLPSVQLNALVSGLAKASLAGFDCQIRMLDLLHRRGWRSVVQMLEEPLDMYIVTLGFSNNASVTSVLDKAGESKAFCLLHRELARHAISLAGRQACFSCTWCTGKTRLDVFF